MNLGSLSWMNDDGANGDEKPEPSKVAETIIEKINTLTSQLQDQIESYEDRLEDLEGRVEDLEDQSVDVDVPDVSKDDIDGLNHRVEDLEETVESFTGVYEAMSSQYNPLVDTDGQNTQQGQPSQPGQQQPVSPQQPSSQQSQQTQQPSKTAQGQDSAHEDEQQQAPSTTEPDTPAAPRSENHRASHDTQRASEKTQQTQSQTQPQHRQPDQSTQNQDSARNDAMNGGEATKPAAGDSVTIKDSLTDEQRQFTIGEEPSRAEQERRKQALQEPRGSDQPGADEPDVHIDTDQHQADDEQTTKQSFLDQLIAKKRQHKERIPRVPHEHAFRTEHHEPARNLLDLAEILADDHKAFEQHVREHRNVEPWVREVIGKPGLADDLAAITARDEYVTTILAAV